MLNETVSILIVFWEKKDFQSALVDQILGVFLKPLLEALLNESSSFILNNELNINLGQIEP